MLARVGQTELAKKAMAYTVSHQLPDGSWWYAEAPNLRWVDNFHTGYVLESLAVFALLEAGCTEVWILKGSVIGFRVAPEESRQWM